MKLAIFEMEKLKKFLVILIIISSYSVFSQYYTGSNIPFGQNRVQYNSFFGNLLSLKDQRYIFLKAVENMQNLQQIQPMNFKKK